MLINLTKLKFDQLLRRIKWINLFKEIIVINDLQRMAIYPQIKT